jgi:hypothetical protein
MLERACARLPDGPERAKTVEFAGFFVLDEQAVKDEEPVSRKRESRRESRLCSSREMQSAGGTRGACRPLAEDPGIALRVRGQRIHRVALVLHRGVFASNGRFPACGGLGFRWVSIEFLGEFQRSSRAPAQPTDAVHAAVE